MEALVNLHYSVWKDGHAYNYDDTKILESSFGIINSHTIEMWEAQERVRVRGNDSSVSAVRVKVTGFYKLDE